MTTANIAQITSMLRGMKPQKPAFPTEGSAALSPVEANKDKEDFYHQQHDYHQNQPQHPHAQQQEQEQEHLNPQPSQCQRQEHLHQYDHNNTATSSLATYYASLVPEIDYSEHIIKGKRILLANGANKYINYMGYSKTETLVESTIDVAHEYIGYVVKVDVINSAGVVISSAIGTANSFEKGFATKKMGGAETLLRMAAKRALVAVVKSLLTK